MVEFSVPGMSRDRPGGSVKRWIGNRPPERRRRNKRKRSVHDVSALRLFLRVIDRQRGRLIPLRKSQEHCQRPVHGHQNPSFNRKTRYPLEFSGGGALRPLSCVPSLSVAGSQPGLIQPGGQALPAPRLGGGGMKSGGGPQRRHAQAGGMGDFAGVADEPAFQAPRGGFEMELQTQSVLSPGERLMRVCIGRGQQRSALWQVECVACQCSTGVPWASAANGLSRPAAVGVSGPQPIFLHPPGSTAPPSARASIWQPRQMPSTGQPASSRARSIASSS